jgi:hypothetical protein
MSPASYLLSLMLALPLLFFPFDLGLRKGTWLGVRYAAFCAARAAATQIPAHSQGRACLTPEAQNAIRHATAACLEAVVSKRNLPDLSSPGVVRELISRTETLLEVRILDSKAVAQTCFADHEEIIAEVSYRYLQPVPLSPLNGRDGVRFLARAQAMLQTQR